MYSDTKGALFIKKKTETSVADRDHEEKGERAAP